ncbi:hypothetical protein A4X13_0g8401, partial [Tilletia indica]
MLIGKIPRQMPQEILNQILGHLMSDGSLQEPSSTATSPSSTPAVEVSTSSQVANADSDEDEEMAPADLDAVNKIQPMTLVNKAVRSAVQHELTQNFPTSKIRRGFPANMLIGDVPEEVLSTVLRVLRHDSAPGPPIIGSQFLSNPPVDASTSKQSETNISSTEDITVPVAVTALKQAQSLALINKSFRSAVQHELTRHFHSFHPPSGPIVRAFLGRWIPRPDARYRDVLKYWQHHVDAAWPDARDLRMQTTLFDKARAELACSITIDCRVPNVAMSTNPYSWSLQNFHHWITSSMLLSRISRPLPRLTHLHLRITAQEDIMLLVESILLSNPQLVDVVIEADTPLEMDFYSIPNLVLDTTTSPDHVYPDMERFIIRSPGMSIVAADSGPFLRRIQKCKTVCFAVHSVICDGFKNTSEWVHKLLAHLPDIERAEVSVSDDESPRSPSREELPRCQLPKLIHLTLDYAAVNADILQTLDAKCLRHVRLRSKEPLGKRGRCPPGWFPNLLTATIYCPGHVVERFRTVGLARRQFIHNMRPHMWYEDDYPGEFLCYVKKFEPREMDKY